MSFSIFKKMTDNQIQIFPLDGNTSFFLASHTKAKQTKPLLEIINWTFKKGILSQCTRRSPLLDAGGNLEYLGKNLPKQGWTGNQMEIQPQDLETNLGSVVHSSREALLYATCFPKKEKSTYQFLQAFLFPEFGPQSAVKANKSWIIIEILKLNIF